MLCRSGDAAPENACVSAEEKAEGSEVLRWDFWIVVGEVYSPRFLVEVVTHRPKARVSAAEKAEEPMCYGGTFES